MPQRYTMYLLNDLVNVGAALFAGRDRVNPD